jgi:HEAT repeat protein
MIAVAGGVILALMVGNLRSAGAGRSGSSGFLSGSNDSSQVRTSSNSIQLDSLKPQKQAEALLEQAVSRSGEAVDQISSRVDRWQGKLSWDSQIATLTTAALNSDDMRVRQSGIEVELAAYGLAKNSASLAYLLKTAESQDHSQKIWALWALGLMGNRGVGTERVVPSLTIHLKDSDEDSRRWAVEGLALVGTTDAVAPLLRIMHDDPSPTVREAAACALAQSGMFTPEQRSAMVPQLLLYSDDPALDAQTHAWAFQALGDITHQHLPNDSAAWRSWYESARSN